MTNCRECVTRPRCRCYDRGRRRSTYIPREVYVDEIAVERAVRGDPPARMTPRERREAVAVLSRWGLSAPEIAGRLRVSQRAVERHRAALRQEAA